MKKLILPLFIIGLISCYEGNKSKTENITVFAPESKPTNFETKDSSFLKIEIKDVKFEINFLNKATKVENLNDFKSFLENNKGQINKDKVVVTGFDTLKNNEDFKNLLKEFEITKFYTNSK
ncbi:MAG: hypothetical protein ABL929_13280 [Ferruginibacter sp.]